MKIERAAQTDLDAIHRLLQEQFGEHDIEIPLQSLRDAIAEMLVNDHWGTFLVAREEGHVIAVAAIAYAWTLEHSGKSAWLDELYVIPKRRGSGIGTALLQEVIKEVSNQGCKAIDLEVEREHRRAERLYEREGFEQLARTRWVRLLINECVSRTTRLFSSPNNIRALCSE
jgi:GNAT superfamily N-acetyltransferase